MFYLPQLTTTDCGVACLKMILADLNKDRQYLFMPCDENHGQYSFKQLCNIAKNNGLSLCGFKVSEKDELRKCNFPAIVRLTNEEDKHHAVIVTKMTSRTVHLVDPHFGKLKMKIYDFYDKWDGTGLFISHFERTIYPYDSIEPLETKHKVTSFMLQIVSGILFALGVFFIQPNAPYYFAVIFIGLGIVVELILRGYIYKLMSCVDEYFLNRYHDVTSKDYYQYYVRCQEFKKTYLTTKLNVVYSLIISLFIMLISLLNSVNNFPIVGAPIVLAGLESLVLSKKEEVEMQKIADQEEDLRQNKNKDEIIMKVKSLQKKAYDFSKYKLIYKFLSILLFTMTAILSMALTNTFTLINLIFSLTIQMFVYQNLLPVFSYEKNVSEIYKTKSKVNNMFYYSIHHKDEND